VILLDEVEKAHQDVFNVLLQLLDDGRLTDGQGRTVDFTNSVLIMTSNLGSEFIAEDLAADVVEERVMKAVRSHFRPEFLNRVDDLIVFHRLTREDLRRIVDLQLERLAARLRERHITIELSDAAKDHLAAEGFDPVYGARPLKRVIQRQIVDPLAMKLLAGEYTDGDKVAVDVHAGELTFSPSEVLRV
jgi:ATP-dependent Clp protease ATP-binding subunit ClpB